MFSYIKHNIESVLLGFMFGASLFILFFGNLSGQTSSTFPASLSANLSIPYERKEAGLTAKVIDDNDRKIITQQYELDENGEIRKDALGNPIEIDKGAIMVGSVLSKLFLILKSILGAVVVFWIVFAGLYIIAGSTDEERVKTGKQMLKYSIFGLAFMLLIEPMVLDVFYGGGKIHTGTTGIGDIQTSTENFRTEALGVMNFIKTVLIFIAMGYVIKAGSQMIFAHGDEEKVSSAKNIFIPMFVGFLIVMFNEIFIDEVLYNISFNSGNEKWTLTQAEFESADGSGAAVFIKEIVAFLKYLLGVITVVLFGFVVYGGFIIMTSMGEDEKMENGKKIIFNSVIGMIIIVSSFILMASLVNFEV